MSEPETTGTTVSATEGAGVASGTPAAATAGGGDQGMTDQERAELAALKQQKEQWLREKSNSEEIRRENERLRLEREQMARAYPPPTGAGIDPQHQQIAQALQNLSERDPEVVQVLSASMQATQAQLQRQANEARYYRELNGIPSDDREEVERIARAEQLWPSLAYDRVRANRYDKERQSLAEQARKLAEEAERRQKGVVNTIATPAPSSAHNGATITSAQYAQFCDDAKRGNTEARRKLRDYDEGRITIRD